MALSAGLTKVCGAKQGGIKRIAIAPVLPTSAVGAGEHIEFDGSKIDAIDAYVTTTNEGGIAFYEFEFEIDTAEVRENGTMENGTPIFTHEVEFMVKGISSTYRDTLNELTDNCGYIVAIEDTQSNLLFIGVSASNELDYPAKLATDATTTGKDIADLSGSTITMSARSTEKVVFGLGLTFDGILAS